MNIKKRLLPAAIIVIVTFGCILISRPTRVLFFAALGVVSAFELHTVLGAAELPVSRPLLTAYIVGQALLCFFGVPALWMIAWLALAAFAAFCEVIFQPSKGARTAVSTVFALLWPCGFYAVVMHAAASDAWMPVLFIGILATWACDSMALIGGKLWGKHKLAPAVSPNKTWEGAIVGGLSSILAGYLIHLILKSFAPVPALPCMAASLAASTFGQFGDLAASAVKRMAGVKDYGNLMPEHGGIMDKMDSMLFAIPAAYFCLYLFGLV